MANETQTVEFIKGKSPYNVGDVAGFPAHVAHVLIGTGIAKPVDGHGAKDVNYRGMPWFKLRAIIKNITEGEEVPTSREHALEILQRRGMI